MLWRGLLGGAGAAGPRGAAGDVLVGVPAAGRGGGAAVAAPAHVVAGDGGGGEGEPFR